MPLSYRKPSDVWAAAEVAAGFAPANAEVARLAFAANTFEALWMQAARHRDRLLGVDPDEDEAEDGPDTGDPGAFSPGALSPGALSPGAVLMAGDAFPPPAPVDVAIPFALAADVPVEVR